MSAAMKNVIKGMTYKAILSVALLFVYVGCGIILGIGKVWCFIRDVTGANDFL